MNGQTPIHFYLNWAKERLAELDAMLAATQAKARMADASWQPRLAHIMSELEIKRAEFRDFIRSQGTAGAAAMAQGREHLEKQWQSCQSEWTKLIENIGEQATQQNAVLRELAEAQLNGWQNLLDSMQSAASTFGTERRIETEALLNKVKQDAASADATLKKMTAAGTESWRAFHTALTESRAAFDRANEAAQRAFSDLIK